LAAQMALKNELIMVSPMSLCVWHTKSQYLTHQTIWYSRHAFYA
jgi:hypothetical protein